MSDLYLLQAPATVLYVGKGSKINQSRANYEFPVFSFKKSGEAHAAIHALLASKAVAAWCFAADGQSAPTAGAGKFNVNNSGGQWDDTGYFVFGATVTNVSEHLTENGPELLLHFQPLPLA